MHTAEPLVPNLVLLRLELLLKSWKDADRKTLIKFCQKWSKQEVIHYGLG